MQKMGVRPYQPRCLIEILFGMVGSLLAVIISLKFQHRLSGYTEL